MKIIKYIMISSIIVVTIISAQSLDELQIDCDAGHAKACHDTGKLYSNQAYKEKNYDHHEAAHKVALLYKKSCDLGYAKGCTAYAMSYATDKQKDTSRDMQYYLQKGCESGDEAGCTMLKMMPDSHLQQKEK